MRVGVYFFVKNKGGMSMIIVLSLLIIGILANYSGLIAEKLKLPSLIGMMIVGMLIGPSYLNLVPQGTLEISSTIKDVALVTVLFIGGLGISLEQIKQIGRPAVLLSVVPATLEGFVIAFLSIFRIYFYSGSNPWVYNSSSKSSCINSLNDFFN